MAQVFILFICVWTKVVKTADIQTNIQPSVMLLAQLKIDHCTIYQRLHKQELGPEPLSREEFSATDQNLQLSS